MIKLYLTECTRENEHQMGRALAAYALFDAFGLASPLAYEKNGKPRFEAKGVFVSISHSGGMCLAAVSDREIGADIQLSDREAERLTSLSERYFSPDELAYVKKAPSERFYEVWCKKESYLKYTGEGLSRRLSDFSVFRLPLEFWSVKIGGYTLALCSDEKYSGEPVFVENNILLTE